MPVTIFVILAIAAVGLIIGAFATGKVAYGWAAVLCLAVIERRRAIPRGMAWLLVGIAAATMATSCACSGTAADNSVACIVTNAAVTCGELNVASLGPALLPVVAALVGMIMGGGGSIDWAALETALAGTGLKTASCILAEITKDFMSSPHARGTPDGMAKAKATRDNWAAYKAKHFPAGTTFLMPDGSRL